MRPILNYSPRRQPAVARLIFGLLLGVVAVVIVFSFWRHKAPSVAPTQPAPTITLEDLGHAIRESTTHPAPRSYRIILDAKTGAISTTQQSDAPATRNATTEGISAGDVVGVLRQLGYSAETEPTTRPGTVRIKLAEPDTRPYAPIIIAPSTRESHVK